MSLLPDTKWKLKYTPEDGNLVQCFYVPALRCANRYDRSTGFFSATALTLAARGIEAVLDDRDERPGVKFKDADLIGFPVRVTLGRALADGQVEFRPRSAPAAVLVAVGGAADAVADALRGPAGASG